MAEPSSNSRLEAFCDGVFAVALTILVIDLKIPSGEAINSTGDLWRALLQLLPSALAFLLSFTIVFITWVNHHGTLKLIYTSTPAFIYANGFLLLTIVVLPFATSVLSENLFSNHAAPAVVLYAAINALQSLSWILLGRAALSPKLLTKDEKSTATARASQRSSYFSFGANIILAVLAFWFPQIVALLIGVIWLGWLVYGIRIRSE